MKENEQEVIAFDLNQTPEQMMEAIAKLPFDALQPMDESMVDIAKNAKIASTLIRMRALTLMMEKQVKPEKEEKLPDGVTLQ